jgi:hypothetical protein
LIIKGIVWILKRTERSDLYKSSIFNSPVKRDLRFAATGLSGSRLRAHHTPWRLKIN